MLGADSIIKLSSKIFHAIQESHRLETSIPDRILELDSRSQANTLSSPWVLISIRLLKRSTLELNSRPILVLDPFPQHRPRFVTRT